MSAKLHVVKKGAHRCDGCGKEGRWNKNWEWYGSYLDLDEGGQITKACSEKCQKAAKAKYRPRKYKRHMYKSSLSYLDSP